MTDIACDKLKYLITQFGRSLCDDPKRCEALLKDVCPQHKREVNLLVAALREGAAKELLNASALMPLESTIKRVANKMHDNVGTAEPLAQWAVESWALALGLTFKSSSPYVVQQNTGNVPQKPIPQAIINQFEGWQKIGTNGEKLSADAPQWAAVIDEKNKLMWAINPSKDADFPNPKGLVRIEEALSAVKQACNQRWCNYSDWRLPTIIELRTLLAANSSTSLHICRNVFTDIDGEYYAVWCLPQFFGVGNWDGDFFVNFGGNFEARYCDHLYVNSVRLVRSSQ